MVFDPNAGANSGSTPSGAGGQFPTIPVYVPSAYQQFAGSPVPGLGHGAAGGQPLTYGGYGGSSHLSSETTPGTPATGVSLAQALHRLLTQRNPAKILQLQEHLIQAGLLDPHDSQGFIAGVVDSSDATYTAYARALNDAIEQHMPLNKLLQSRISDPGNTLGQTYWQTYQSDQSASASGGVKTQTSTSVNYTNGTDARAAAQNAYESELGRRVNDHEAAAFQSALNAYEAAHPSVTTTSSNASGQTVNSTSSGGVNPSDFADQNVIQQHGKEFAQAQGDQLYDLFASVIGGH